MTKQVVEYQGEPVGIAVAESGGYKFIAVKYHVMPLDNHLYPSVAAVQNAIRSLDLRHTQVAA
jgi:hypothetical protein